MCISYCIRFLQSTAEDLYSTGFQTWSFHALSGLRGLMINAELGRTRPNLLHIQILDPLERWPDSVKLSWSYIPLLSSDTLCIWTILDPISETDQPFLPTFTAFQVRQLRCLWNVSSDEAPRLKQRSFCRSPKLLTKAPQRGLQQISSNRRTCSRNEPNKIAIGKSSGMQWVTYHIASSGCEMCTDAYWCALSKCRLNTFGHHKIQPNEPLRLWGRYNYLEYHCTLLSYFYYIII